MDQFSLCHIGGENFCSFYHKQIGLNVDTKIGYGRFKVVQDWAYPAWENKVKISGLLSIHIYTSLRSQT